MLLINRCEDLLSIKYTMFYTLPSAVLIKPSVLICLQSEVDNERSNNLWLNCEYIVRGWQYVHNIIIIIK